MAEKREFILKTYRKLIRAGSTCLLDKKLISEASSEFKRQVWLFSRMQKKYELGQRQLIFIYSILDQALSPYSKNKDIRAINTLYLIYYFTVASSYSKTVEKILVQNNSRLIIMNTDGLKHSIDRKYFESPATILILEVLMELHKSRFRKSQCEPDKDISAQIIFATKMLLSLQKDSEVLVLAKSGIKGTTQMTFEDLLKIKEQAGMLQITDNTVNCIISEEITEIDNSYNYLLNSFMH